MHGIRRRIVWAMVAVLGVAVPAAAQPAESGDLTHATALEGLVGAAFDSTGSGLLLGGTIAWSMNSRFAIEGAGEWFSFDENYDAFAAAVALRTRFGTSPRLRGFAKGGIGLYRADLTGRSCETTPAACGEPALPAFYGRRWHGEGMQTRGGVFTDPSVVLGAGADIMLTRRFGLRPAADVRLVFRDGHTHAVSSLAVAAVVQFEHHPVTPSRR